MREDKTKITVKYKKSDNIVLGYFPNDMNYPNESFIDTNDMGYIEISKQAWKARPERAIVNGESLEAFIKPDSQLLQEAKNAKIIQIKVNRKESNQKDLILVQAKEITDNGDGSFTTTTDLVNFSFRTRRSGDELTNPSNLINACLRGVTIRYSCEILNPSRRGYVEITQAIAENIESHLINRGQNNVYYANTLEDEINNCSTVEEVEAIDINFS